MTTPTSFDTIAPRPGAQWKLGTDDVIRNQRVADTFITLNAVAIGAETTLWTPTGTRSFRLMGGLVSFGTAPGNVLLKSSTGGTTIGIIPKHPIDTAFQFNFGENGISGLFPTHALTATGVATQTISGTIWGIEDNTQ